MGLPQYKDAFLEARIDAREVTESSQPLSKTTKKLRDGDSKRKRNSKKPKRKEKWEMYLSREI